jgi:hypothetical protein
VTAPDEPPVVGLEQLLGDQEDGPPARPAVQVVLIATLCVVGLVAVCALALLLAPGIAELVRWIVAGIRQAGGA